MSTTAAQSHSTGGLELLNGLNIPWEARRSPHFREHQSHARDLAVKLKVISGEGDSDTRRFEAFVAADAYSYPYPSLERLNAAGAFNQWLYLIDDQYDDHPEVGRDVAAVTALMERSLGILGNGVLPSLATPFDHFTAHVREVLSGLAPQGWYPRFLSHVEEYLLHGSLAAMQEWARAEVSTVDDYLAMRLYDSALFAIFDVVELAAEAPLPPEVRVHPMLDELRFRTARHVSFANDLFSYQKEVLRQGYAFNLLHVLKMQCGMSLKEALAEAHKILNDDLLRFSVAERCLPSWGPEVDSAVVRYIDGLKAWIRGNIDFSLASARFHAADSPFLELRR